MGKKAKNGSSAITKRWHLPSSFAYRPRKLNLVAQSIRGLDCGKALAQLEFLARRIAQDVKKLLESAIANAENNHQLDVDRLYVAEASVGRPW